MFCNKLGLNSQHWRNAVYTLSWQRERESTTTHSYREMHSPLLASLASLPSRTMRMYIIGERSEPTWSYNAHDFSIIGERSEPT